MLRYNSKAEVEGKFTRPSCIKNKPSMDLMHEWQVNFEEKWLQRMLNYYRLGKRDQFEC
jgi:hypothetical protein